MERKHAPGRRSACWIASCLGVCALDGDVLRAGDDDGVAAPGGKVDAARDERVTLYPTAAALVAAGTHWRVPLHFEVFEPEHDDPLRVALLEPLRRDLAIVEGSAAANRFRDRVRHFLVDHERREHRVLALAGRRFELGPSEPNGHVLATVELPVAELAAWSAAQAAAGDGAASPAAGAPKWLDVDVEAPAAAGRTRGRVQLIGPHGWSVVSDLDDTLKITEVADKSRALARTFLEPFAPVAGMPPLCRRLAARGAAFHYVSLSPWQLALPLQAFLAAEGFPEGTLELQHFRLQDGDFADLVGDSRQKKLAVLEPLLAQWPQRRFVLIGDSGQADAEVYADLARRRPGQVAAIWIRRTPPAGGEPAAGSDAARVRDLALQAKWSAAFAGLPAELWRVFTDPAELALPQGMGE